MLGVGFGLGLGLGLVLSLGLVPPLLYIYIYIYISYIKCNNVTLYERILTCFIIYRNAILTFLTLFVKYVFERKKNINFMLKK